VLIFTAAALILTVLFCGLAPALAAIRGALANDLRMQGTGRGATAHSWLAQSPVVIQVALSVAVLAGAGLLLHSLYNLETKDIGFDRDNVVAVNFTCCRTTRGITDSLAMESEILTRARNLPGVRSASFSSYSQTSRRLGINVAVEGAPAGSVDQQHVFFNFVSPGYFETMGIPILVGRDFRSHDDAGTPMTAVINRTMAHHYFGDTNPIGRRFTFVEGKWPPFEIIGVAADSVYNDLREETPDFVYVDHTKFLAFRGAIGTTVLGGILNVRANGRANSLSRPLMDLIRSFDTAAVVQNIRTLREQIDLSLHRDRLIAALCSTFSLLALVLTCIGLYGTLSFSVARRTNEIGVRMALGASPHNIFTLVIGQGIRLTIIGLFVGAAGAIASGYLLASLLFGVKRADPVTLAGVALLLLAAAVLACYVPARRAMGVNPLVALRDE
ncbi:MAG TPA: ABC transporter permease, partial [Candidatus Acidoferrum sp.]|nr:ABC transporter permease [Candidatus Acidoferrum sp.]